MTARPDRFGGCTEPHRDFVEWEAFDTFWLQLGEGEARPAHPLRFRGSFHGFERADPRGA